MADFEKHNDKETVDSHQGSDLHNGYAPEGQDAEVGIVNKSAPLARDLRGRHMQMIAIGELTNPYCQSF